MSGARLVCLKVPRGFCDYVEECLNYLDSISNGMPRSWKDLSELALFLPCQPLQLEADGFFLTDVWLPKGVGVQRVWTLRFLLSDLSVCFSSSD